MVLQDRYVTPKTTHDYAHHAPKDHHVLRCQVFICGFDELQLDGMGGKGHGLKLGGRCWTTPHPDRLGSAKLQVHRDGRHDQSTYVA